MSDKVIFITGCSSRIDIETAGALKATSVTLYHTSRDFNKFQGFCVFRLPASLLATRLSRYSECIY